ncbi:unnamed protein product [Musa acuminata subsp. malaccensis]|uniref:(wild Malaysian banana) hypothetical protein n=1 Tax=Musa acuminata subsp. malaccensis TaxID=214687 RepID=A0A804HLV1_MUSAM|nr:unnamed protein product [Musa acuminata subsp. malaccensis]
MWISLNRVCICIVSTSDLLQDHLAMNRVGDCACCFFKNNLIHSS